MIGRLRHPDPQLSTQVDDLHPGRHGLVKLVGHGVVSSLFVPAALFVSAALRFGTDIAQARSVERNIIRSMSLNSIRLTPHRHLRIAIDAAQSCPYRAEMDSGEAFRSAEQIERLADMTCSLRDGGLPSPLAARAEIVLLDLFGVTVAGARTSEMTRLRRAWLTESGTTAPLGTPDTTTVETAAQLDAIASCCLELDEGNKYAAGHPAAHVVPAAIAAVRMSTQAIDGSRFLAAVVAGYEVATRFGYALDRDPRWHTHGHWGATGAAAAAASIMGLDATGVAAAIDASSALVHVAPWAVVLDGNFTRNLWIAGAVRAGLDASRLAGAGLVSNSGAAAQTLGDIVGTMNYDRLTEDLGSRWFMLEGYCKQHASCSYTHAAVDTIQSLKAGAEWTADDVETVHVRTHSLAAPLFQRHPTSRLAAMFSLPFVVAASFVTDTIDAAALDPAGPTFDDAERFSERVSVCAADDLDALLPARRAAEVTVTLRGGDTISAITPNPVGDVDHFPMDIDAVRTKVERLTGVADAQVVHDVVEGLRSSDDVAGWLRPLCAISAPPGQ
jgi:2-methylcitrate dehydratase PrpD